MLKRNPNRKPSLPGQILHELYLKPHGVTIKAFAGAVGCTPKHMSNVVHGKARIEAELATRIAMVLDTSTELWMNLQNDVDIWVARQKMKSWKPHQTLRQLEARA
jgi:addiction module HigA family antidote